MIIVPAARAFIGGALAWGPRNLIGAKTGTAGTCSFAGLTIPAGALVVLGVDDQSAATTPMGVMADTAGNIWSNTGWGDVGAGGNAIFWSRFSNPLAAGSITYTTKSGTNICVAGGIWATGPQGSSYDSAGYANLGTSVATPFLTSGVPSHAGELFFAMYSCVSTAGTITNDPSWDSAGIVNPTGTTLGLAVASRINAGAGAVSYAPTITSNRVSRLVTAAFHL